MHKKDQGKIGEAAVIQQALHNGCSVFVEFGDNSKIDLILSHSKTLYKVQVKAVGREVGYEDVSKLYLTKSGPDYCFRYDHSDVDWFAMYDMQIKEIAWIEAKWALSNFGTMLVLKHSQPLRKYKKVKMFRDYVNFPFTA